MKSKHSVIQTSLLKISILLFCIFSLLYFFIMYIYWSKAAVEKKFELFSKAVTVETIISTNLNALFEIMQNGNLTDEQKTEKIDSLLIPMFEKIPIDNSLACIGYYDDSLDYCFQFCQTANKVKNEYLPDHKDILKTLKETKEPQFFSNIGIYGLDGRGIIAVAVPVFAGDRIIGHTWAISSASVVYLTEYINYSMMFVPIIVLILFVLMIVNKSINRIKNSLNNFTQSILNDNLVDQQGIADLPELQPVFDRIRVHLENLHVLNQKLEAANEKLSTIMEGISDGFFSLDPNWRFSFVNSRFKEIFSKEEADLTGEVIWEALPEIDSTRTAAKLRESVNLKKPMTWEEVEIAESQIYKVYSYPYANGVTVFIRDITLSRQQENEMKKLERLNLIGQMAAGISHEVRNPITTVRGFLQVLQSRTDSVQNKEFMDLMISEIDRANAIITDFLSLAKANVDCTKLLNLNDIITRIYPMVQADAFNCNKEVLLELGEIPDLELNESEIRQLLLNLVRNGLEATPERGKVEIKTYLQGDSVVLAVKDEGKGIPPEVRDKIGTPFLTTKETGTGLGLAISIGIANRHNARFDFATSESGTTFFVSFPLKKSSNDCITINN